jgi:hypothetical protein
MKDKRLFLVSVILLSLLVGTGSVIATQMIIHSYWQRKAARATEILNKNFQSEKEFYAANKDRQ